MSLISPFDTASSSSFLPFHPLFTPQTMMHERLYQFLQVRKETNCGASGRAFTDGDRVMRLTKCQHWFVEEELRKVVVGKEKEHMEDGECWTRYWKEECRVEILCPVCARHMRVEVRD